MEQGTAHAHTKPTIVEPVYIENNLLRIFGVLFCHDPKRARARNGTVEISKGVKERGIAVRFDPEYAQPGPFAHKVALAVIRKQSRYGRPIRKEISFSQRELGRLAGRTSFGGKDSAELAHALKQIRYTHVLAHFKRDDRFVQHDFSIFNEVLIERRALPTDPIIACTVVLAEPIVQSLSDKHFTCLNHTTLEQLGTIGQAFYMRLFFHFATHYDGHHAQRLIFRKRYDDICAEWLGGLTVLEHRSKILGEQLGRHLRQLTQVGFLASYALSPAANKQGFVFSFRPGAAFFSDYQRFYVNRARASVSIEFNDDQQAIAEPLQIAYLFLERRTGKKREGIPFVSTKEVETAKQLLAKLSFAEVPPFLDYALGEARKTNFDIQTLGGVKQYLDDYLRIRTAREAARVAVGAHQEAEDKEYSAYASYDRFIQETANGLFQTLPTTERAAIEALVGARTPHYAKPGGSIANLLASRDIAKIVAERYPERILSFEQWRTR